MQGQHSIPSTTQCPRNHIFVLMGLENRFRDETFFNISSEKIKTIRDHYLKRELGFPHSVCWQLCWLVITDKQSQMLYVNIKLVFCLLIFNIIQEMALKWLTLLKLVFKNSICFDLNLFQKSYQNDFSVIKFIFLKTTNFLPLSIHKKLPISGSNFASFSHQNRKRNI